MTDSIDLDPTTDPRWADLVAGGSGTLFNSPRWLRAVSRTYGFEPHASVLRSADGISGGLAYTVIDDVRGRRVVGYPFSDFCEPVAVDAEAWRTMVDPVLELGPLTLRCRDGLPPADDDRFERSVDLLWHAVVIDHDLDDETRFTRVDSKFRQNVRRATRMGVDVTVGSDEAHLRTFFELHVATRVHKHRLLPQPYLLFEQLRSEFGEDLIVALAHHDDRPIAGILFLASGGSLYYKFNASDPTADLSVRPNELLLWTGIRLAAERGFDNIDLGVSDVVQPELVRYKRKVATEERQVVTMRRHSGDRAPGPGLDELVTSLRALAASEDVGDETARRVTDLLDGADLGGAGVTEVEKLLAGLTSAFIDHDPDPAVSERAGSLLYRYFA